MRCLIPALSLLFILALASCNSEKKPEEIAGNEKKVSIEEVEQGIRDNIEEITRENNGYFPITNDSIELNLKLVRVHTEYLSVLGKNKFFACVDLATENGDVYDVDFFLDGEPGDMNVTKQDVHKLNGKPYYTWKQKKDKTWFTVPVKNASNDLLGVKEGTDSFTFTYHVTLPEIDGKGQLWLPIAQSDRWQKIEIVKLDAPEGHRIGTDKVYGNSVLFLDLTPSHSGEEIVVQYNVQRIEKSAYLENESDTNQYLMAAPLLPVGDRFTVIADQVIQEKQAKSQLAKARALYDHIIDEMRYAKEGIYGTGDANYACDSKSGNCTEFHSYFISLARSAGIPARFAVGAAIPSERNEGGVDGYHCWAEFYSDGKWWPVDISEANKYSALATYYFGHHPANRIEFSRGRNIATEPEPAGGPINFLAYPVIEIKGEPVYAKTQFTFQRDSQGI